MNDGTKEYFGRQTRLLSYNITDPLHVFKHYPVLVEYTVCMILERPTPVFFTIYMTRIAYFCKFEGTTRVKGRGWIIDLPSASI